MELVGHQVMAAAGFVVYDGEGPPLSCCLYASFGVNGPFCWIVYSMDGYLIYAIRHPTKLYIERNSNTVITWLQSEPSLRYPRAMHTKAMLYQLQEASINHVFQENISLTALWDMASLLSPPGFRLQFSSRPSCSSVIWCNRCWYS